MTAARKEQPPTTDDRLFENARAIIALAQSSFAKAAKAAVAENDLLGIPTHGAGDGKLMTRVPPKIGEQG